MFSNWPVSQSQYRRRSVTSELGYSTIYYLCGRRTCSLANGPMCKIYWWVNGSCANGCMQISRRGDWTRTIIIYIISDILSTYIMQSLHATVSGILLVFCGIYILPVNHFSISFMDMVIIIFYRNNIKIYMIKPRKIATLSVFHKLPHL